MQKKYIFHGFILWLQSLTVLGNDIKCNHMEEETAAQLHFVWSPNQTSRAKLMILLNEAEVVLCYLEPVKCTPFSKLTKATIKSMPTQRYEITVSVLGVKSSGYWKVRYINEADVKNDTVCKFIMFARAKDLKCQSLSREEIHIYCFSKRILPSAACIMNYTDNKENYVLEEGRQLHSKDTFRNDTHLLASTCTFVKPASIATTDTFTALVTMFPNISGSQADIMYGTSVSVLVTLSKPFIKFENCPAEVDLGDAIDCICIGEGIEPVNAMFRWYNKVTNAVISNTSRLTFVATEQSEEFSCVVDDVLNKRNISLTYVLHVNNSQNLRTSISNINSSNKDKPDDTTIILGDTASPSTESENLEAFLIATVVMASVAASFTISTVIACYRYHSIKKKRLKDNYDELDTRITDRMVYHRPQVNAQNSSSSCASGYLDVVSSRSSSPRDSPAEAGTDANPYAEIGEMCMAGESKTADE